MSEYRDETRLEHMLEAVRRIRRMSDGLRRDQLAADDEKTMALAYQFVVLGEVANRISASCAAAHPEVDWAGVAGFRHRLVHGYDQVDYDVMWNILETDIPALLPELEKIVAGLPPVPPQPKNLMMFL